jgi:hypothetical protein
MKRWRTLSVVVVAALGPGAWAQAPGVPVRPAQPVAYVYNNTDGPVRFTLCSGAGIQSGELQPGQYRPVPFEPVSRPRILTVFSARTYALISNRQVELNAGYYYLARLEGESVTAPGKTDEKTKEPPKPAIDRGQKEIPKTAKETKTPDKKDGKP